MKFRSYSRKSTSIMFCKFPSRPTGTDFTQHKQRKKFAEMCFGDDPPTLELLVINGPSIPLIQKDVSLKLPDESIRAT